MCQMCDQTRGIAQRTRRNPRSPELENSLPGFSRPFMLGSHLRHRVSHAEAGGREALTGGDRNVRGVAVTRRQVMAPQAKALAHMQAPAIQRGARRSGIHGPSRCSDMQALTRWRGSATGGYSPSSNSTVPVFPLTKSVARIVQRPGGSLSAGTNSPTAPPFCVASCVP